PADEQQHIFDEFWRSERTATHEHGGLGLGLAICKHLVELHGGTISVRSDGRSGAGTMFVITLPTLKPASEPFASLVQQLAPSHQVLLLADQQTSGTQLADRLAHHGYTVQLQVGDTGVEHLIGSLASRPGAILLESRIANRRGWEVVRALQSLRDRDPIPV